MEELRALLAKLQAQLDDPGLYARDAAKFASVSEAFAKAEAELQAAEEDWLELEIRREEIGGRDRNVFASNPCSFFLNRKLDLRGAHSTSSKDGKWR